MAQALKEVKLRFIEGENEGIEIRLEIPREVVIGRGEDCDIYLGEKKISRRHAKLMTSKNALVLEDLKSTNGTFVNGKRVNKEQLSTEDSVRIGASVFQIDFIYQDEASQPQSGAGAALGALLDESSVPGTPSYGNINIEKKMRTATPPPSIGKAPATPPRSPSSPPQDEMPAIEIDIDGGEIHEQSKPITLEPTPKRGASLPPQGPPPAARPLSGQPSAVTTGKKGLAGNLSAMPLSDLLQTFGNSQRNGMLKITGTHRGQIYLKNGKITHAYLEQGVTGEKALTRMLAWKEAEFELVNLPEKFTAAKSLGNLIESSTENLLMEGFRQLDEMENLKKSLPAENATLSLNNTMDNPLSKLHPRVLDVLQLIIKHKTYAKVLDASSYSDLDTAKMIFYLMKKSYIQAS